MGAEVVPVTGIILAGGRSSRFGVDKASFVWRGRALSGGWYVLPLY